VGRLTLLRGFKRVLGVSPGEYARAQRVARFKDAIRPPKPLPATRAATEPAAKRITDAIYEAGFGSSSRLYESSNDALGMTPRTMRAGGAGLLIRYTTAASPLGRMLVAATPSGVCAIAFGRDDAELIADLRQRFDQAQLVAAKGNTGWLANAVAFISSQTTEHPLAATFAVAREIGQPTATRAVAAACGANPIAVAVPCHRVIGKDGSVTGYRWGIERKRKLLAAESLRDA
jgi:AraC family transcriptional regulator of adaptative response/methylated-DNA-[protein]-cysteine methyltransferase